MYSLVVMLQVDQYNDAITLPVVTSRPPLDDQLTLDPAVYASVLLDIHQTRLVTY